MNDLISRKALLAEYDRLHIGEPGKARKLIEDAPRVDAVDLPMWATERAYKNGYEQGKMDALKWIPVSERLPNRNDIVIAFYPTMRGTSGEMQIHKAWAMSDTCTHWMPLPEPPKGE